MLSGRAPSRPREPMKESERWTGHVVFLTITSALAAALIAAFAAIFSDPDKIPGTGAKVLIVLAALFVVISLGTSLLASARLANYLIRADGMSWTERSARGAGITRVAGVAFFALFFSAAALLVFLVWVAFAADHVPPTSTGTAAPGSTSPVPASPAPAAPGPTPAGSTPSAQPLPPPPAPRVPATSAQPPTGRTPPAAPTR